MGAGCCKEDNGPLEGDVGKGAFGKVRIVQKKDTKLMYALKYINKEKCIKMKAVENIIQERNLLEDLEHPFIVNLRFAFQDDENMFMIIDLMLGGDLRYHLDRQFSLPEKQVQFYSAEISNALCFLHSKGIVHRDLKPDNLLLDEKGHIHLTDFNIAVYLPPEGKLLKSVAGTMAYMAPEILEKKGYLQTCDWWSLGVLLYECAFGKRPFRGKSNESLINSILKDAIPIPKPTEEISADCLSFIFGLMQRDLTKRIGCFTSSPYEDIKKHSWFKSINWEALEKKAIDPPFVPDQKKANFDATYELEELLLEDNPLKAKKRTYKPGETKLSSDMQLIEDKFRPFNTNKENGKKTKDEAELKRLILESEKLEQLRAHQLEQEAMAKGVTITDKDGAGSSHNMLTKDSNASSPQLDSPNSPIGGVKNSSTVPPQSNTSSTNLANRSSSALAQKEAAAQSVVVADAGAKDAEGKDNNIILSGQKNGEL